MADSNRINLAYVAESTWGTTPSGPPTLQDVRLTSESIGQDTNTVTSAEIRSDRQIPFMLRTGISVSGDTNHELSYGTYDDWWASVFYSAGWSSAVAVATASTSVSVTGAAEFTHSSAWTNNPAPGTWIKVSGFVAANNNGIFKVAASTNTTITIEQGGLTVEGATPAITISGGSQIVNGTTETSFTFEKTYTDLASTFAVTTGMIPSGASINVASDQIVTNSFSWLGKVETSGSATVGDGSNTAASTTTVMNAIDNVGPLWEGVSAMAITAFTAELENNLRARLQVGTLGPISIGTGFVGAQGTLQAYYTAANTAVINKYLADTVSSLAVKFQDAAGNVYVLDYPSVKYTAGRRVSGGQNQDILLDLSWSAFRDATEGVTVRMVRFPA